MPSGIHAVPVTVAIHSISVTVLNRHRNGQYMLAKTLCIPDFCRISLGTQGSLMSPNYPYYYGGDLDCLWEIRAPERQYAALNITLLRLAGAVEDIIVKHHFLL